MYARQGEEIVIVTNNPSDESQVSGRRRWERERKRKSETRGCTLTSAERRTQGRRRTLDFRNGSVAIPVTYAPFHAPDAYTYPVSQPTSANPATPEHLAPDEDGREGDVSKNNRLNASESNVHDVL